MSTTKVPNTFISPQPPSALEITASLNSKANASDLNNYVDLTSTQYITGYKKFKAGIVIGEQNNQNDLEFRAANGDRVGFIRGNKLSDDSHNMSITSVDVVNNTTYFNGINLTSKGTAKTIELTQNPDTSDNSTQIATTAFVNNASVIKKSRLTGTIVTNSTNVTGTPYNGCYYANGIMNVTICCLIATNDTTSASWKSYTIIDSITPKPICHCRGILVDQSTGLSVTCFYNNDTGVVQIEQKQTTFAGKWLYGGFTVPVNP